MDKNVRWFMDQRINRTKEAFEKNNYTVYVVDTRQQAVEKLKAIIEKGSVVAVGGSVTLKEGEILQLLRCGDYNFLDRYKDGLSADEIGDVFRKSFFADYYITGSNAITEEGQLVNLDGNGNRVAAITFGPKRVVIVAGENKIVSDAEEAYRRVRYEASPINCKRLNKKTPCTQTGCCMDCNSPDRICNHYVVTYRQNVPGRGILIIIKEQLGY